MKYLKQNNKEKVKELAKDALKWQSAKRLVVGTQQYFVPIYNGTYVVDVTFKDSYKKIFTENPSIKCRTCALGGLLFSHVYKYNGFYVGSYETVGGNLLLQYFTPRQLNIIEAAFEGKCYSLMVPKVVGAREEDILLYKACIYIEEYDDVDRRFRNIMLRLAKHGEFTFPRWVEREYKKDQYSDELL